MRKGRSLEDLLGEMTDRSHHCLRITEDEMRTLLAHGGEVVSVQESERPKSFWVEVGLSGGYFFADSKTDPRQKAT